MMFMQYLFILFFEALQFKSSNIRTCNKAMSSKELVVDLGDNMGNNNQIELVGVEESIHSSEVVMVYL